MMKDESLLRILVIDDDDLYARVVARSFRKLRAEVRIATKASEASSLLEAGFDGCVIDIHLGVGEPSGLELLREARTRGVRIPALVVTADSEPAHSQSAAALQAFFCFKDLPHEAVSAFLGAVAEYAARADDDGSRFESGLRALEVEVGEQFTAAELAFLRAVRRGIGHREYALESGLSENTVESHARAVRQKTGERSVPAVLARIWNRNTPRARSGEFDVGSARKPMRSSGSS